MTNTLYYGDNLDILKRYVKDESVDLVYLDPPFKSNQNYNVLFEEKNGSRSAAQIRAFEDTWRWDESSARAYEDVVDGGGNVAQAMVAFRTYLGENDMLAYLAMMAPRLVELHRVMEQTATIYLHCDPAASHYLKLLMDAVFRPGNFRNEIVWCYRGAGYPKRDFGRRHDTIFRYSKSDDYIMNVDAVREPYAQATKERFKHYIGNVRGNKDFGLQELNPLGKHPDDWWQIQPIAPSAKERLGYPTQKPEALLERIIQASSDKEDVVLDPFCGCGTSIAVAHRLKRRWIGVDITHLAVGLVKRRLYDAYGIEQGQDYEVMCEPTDQQGALELAQADPHQFEHWALGLVHARASAKGKGADKGIDGRLYFHDEGPGGKTKQAILSVKAGKITAAHVRDLRGVVGREKAAMGVLISMRDFTKPMKSEAASAGFYSSPWGKKYPKIQLLTVADLLAGKQIEMPPIKQVGTTFKKATKQKRKGASQGRLLEG